MVTLKTTQPNKQAIPQNIFENPIAGGKTMLEKRKEHIRAKNLRKGYSYLIFTAVILIAYSVTFLYPQTTAYLKTPGQIDELAEQIEDYDNVFLPDLEKEKDLHKSAYDEEFEDVENVLDKVFPEDINKFEIVRMLENFATSIHTKTPPFEFNSISFSQPKEEEDYTILPISTSIHSSTTNFDRFLQLINLSGHLDADISIRLMEISNVNIRYRGADPRTGEDKGVDFSVKLNAYSR